MKNNIIYGFKEVVKNFITIEEYYLNKIKIERKKKIKKIFKQD